MDEREALARQRFFMLQALRLGGAIMAMIGAIIISGQFVDMPALGYVLLVLGAVEFFVLPNMVARKWRSPDK
ncbi:MAG: hypothetical protein HKO05_10840 [Erythrobacter sp.]|jgi:hypothetical protein|nr:hypothetical protein [Erythrobacter sp.]RZV30531.1 MAG: hypothetical protein EX262_09485 [Sphingomonadaceae bacterium]